MSDNPVQPLNINDLRSVLNIINVCSARGVFRPNELENVGRLYNKLNQFVESVSVNNETVTETPAKEENMNNDNKVVNNEGEDNTGGHSMDFKEV